MPRASRREILQYAAAGGALLTTAACAGMGQRRNLVSGRLRHACIGVGGMGSADMERIGNHEEVDIVALCDVDETKLNEAAEKHPNARVYRDWRVLLVEEQGRIDSVNVTTPDHMHAPIAFEALKREKHVYCQKPLTRTVDEARVLAKTARRARVVTQMGIQNHSNGPYASALELFAQDRIGKVYEVHVWSDRPAGWWPQGQDRPEEVDEVPETLDWDKWLGVAPERPYKEGAYHAFVWRGWQDFGTGAQGDMGCHLMDPAPWFLELGAPLSLRSDGPAPNTESYPDWSRVHYEFAPTRHTTRGPLQLTWYDGGKQAPRELLDELGAGEVWANACLFVGTEGAILASPYNPPRLLPEERFAGVEIPVVEGRDHWHQFVDACRGITETSAPFDYAAKLTEIALLGNAALHYPHETLAWDDRRMRFPSRPELDAQLTQRYREGWSVRGLG